MTEEDELRIIRDLRNGVATKEQMILAAFIIEKLNDELCVIKRRYTYERIENS